MNVVASKLHTVSGLKEGMLKCHKTPVHFLPWSAFDGLFVVYVLFWVYIFEIDMTKQALNRVAILKASK